MSIFDKIDDTTLTSQYFEDCGWKKTYDYTTKSFIEGSYCRMVKTQRLTPQMKIITCDVNILYFRGWLNIFHEKLWCETIQDLEDGIILLLNKNGHKLNGNI